MPSTIEAVLLRTDRILASIDRALSFVGATLMLAVMAIVATDVAMRYLFNSPLSWSYDLIGIFLMAGIFFLFISDTFRENGHVAVDIVQNLLPAYARRISLAVAHSCAVLVFLAIAVTGGLRAWQSFLAGEVLAGAIAWPVWIAAAFVPLGAGLLSIRLVLAVSGHLLSLALKEDAYPLPAISGEEDAI